MTRDEIIRRGESAGRLLGDKTTMAALEAIQADCAEEWARSGPLQTEVRDSAYRMHTCVNLLKLKLETWRADAATEINKTEQNRIERYA